MIQIAGSQLSQWDVGRSVIVSDSNATHVHFANQGDSKAPIIKIENGEAIIPDYLLQTGKPLLAYAVLDGVTLESRSFSVRKRARPENYVYDDDQRNYIYDLVTNMEAAVENANTAADKANQAAEACRSDTVCVTAEADGTYTSSKSYSEIMTAKENDQVICCTYNNLTLPLISATQLFCTFEMIHYAGEVAGGYKNYRVTIHSNDMVQVSITPLEVGGLSGSGVHVGSDEPTNGSTVWLDLGAGADVEGVLYHEENIDVKTDTDHVDVVLPCSILRFNELHIHTIHGGYNETPFEYRIQMGNQQVSALILAEAKAACADHIAFYKGGNSNLMYYSISTTTMYTNFTPSLSPYKWWGCQDLPNLKLFSNAGAADIKAGTTIKVYGTYSAKGSSAALKFKDPETGEWETIPALQGAPGYTPIKGVDYFTPEDINDIAGMVDCPGGGNLTVTDDGNGNITITATGDVTFSDDGEGNLIIHGIGASAPGGGTSPPGESVPGEDGGYYTPNVEQVDESTMEVSFTASKEGMPVVQPKSITLPEGLQGNPGNDYTLTPEDKQDIAELVAGMVDVPSGGSGKYRPIRKIVVDEANQSSVYTISTEENGNPFELEHVCIIASIPKCEHKSDGYLRVNHSIAYSGCFTAFEDADYNWFIQADKVCEKVVVKSSHRKTAYPTSLAAEASGSLIDKITEIQWYTSSGTQKYSIGSTFEIYGY